MLTILLKLVLAHLIGDFLIQPYSWVKDKEIRKIRSPYLYAHIAIHFGLLLVVLAFDMNYWMGILVIISTHYAIDTVKLYTRDIFSARKAFFVDQVLHLAILVGVVLYYFPTRFQFSDGMTTDLLLFLIALLMCTSVASIIMRVIITRWQINEDKNYDSLKDAGNYIGMLERILVFIFIITDHWEGVGFLLAAKSVFRFGDLSRAQDRKMTEYVLIGTMISFGLAILTGLGYLYFKTLT